MCVCILPTTPTWRFVILIGNGTFEENNMSWSNCFGFQEINDFGLKMNSEQRRLERYHVMYIWKIMEGLTPNCGVTWSQMTERNGRLCKIPPLKGTRSVQTLRNQSFQVSGPRLFNSMPKTLRNMTNCSLEEFKESLDTFLKNVPDEPKSESLTPRATNHISGRQTNSLIYQLAKVCSVTPRWSQKPE